jgi:hypothetical protein
VCGHYDCGGVRAALKTQDLGTMENWIRNIRDVVRLHQVRRAIVYDVVGLHACTPRTLHDAGRCCDGVRCAG